MSEGLMNMVLGMGFVFVFLTILVGYMYAVAGRSEPGRKDAASLPEFGGAETSNQVKAADLDGPEPGTGLDPGLSAAIGMALFQCWEEEQGTAMEAGRGPDSPWTESGRKRMMNQREMWFFRSRG